MRDWDKFYGFYALVYPFTMLGSERLWGLYQAVELAVVDGLPGDIVECGTAKGGSAALMGLVLKGMGSDKSLYVCDTFEGIPAPTEKDPPEAQQYTGQLRGEFGEVANLFSSLEVEAILVKGLFQDTLPNLNVDKIAVLHLDGDWYESTKCGLESLYDKVVPGGIVQIDDYGHWEGCRKATDEFFEKRGIKPILEQLDYTGVQFVKGES